MTLILSLKQRKSTVALLYTCTVRAATPANTWNRRVAGGGHTPSNKRHPRVVATLAQHCINNGPICLTCCMGACSHAHEFHEKRYQTHKESDIWPFGEDNQANFQLWYRNFYHTLSIYVDFAWVDGGHFEYSVIIKNSQRCQSGMLAHINRDISCIKIQQKSLYIPICKVPPSATWL